FSGRGPAFLRNVSTQTAATAYIVVVGLVYAFLLRHLLNPQGVSFATDVVFHDVMPVLYPLYWLMFVPKGALRWIDAVCWLAFPALYFAYCLLRGTISGVYPYPFIDVNTLGYTRVFLNATLLTAGFLGLGLILIAIDHWMGRGTRREAS